MKPKPLASLNHLTVPLVRIFPTPRTWCKAGWSRPPFAGRSLGKKLFDARPQLGSDAVAQLGVQLAEHEGNSARVEPGDAGFLDHCREVDARLTDHSPEHRGPIRA